MKTKRLTRKSKLTKAGFLPFEAQELSQIKKMSPYLQKMISSRRMLLKNAKRYEWSKAEYDRRVKLIYGKEKIEKFVDGKKVRSPWDLLRRFEDRYKDRFPAYETPTSKKQSRTKDFSWGALETGRNRRKKAKYSGGKPYG